LFCVYLGYMMSARLWVIVNVSLGFVAVLLFLNLFDVQFPTLGKAQYLLDKEKPLCAVQWRQDFTLWNDLDQCCLQARQQFNCDVRANIVDGRRFDKVCHTGEGDVLKYWLNNKAYRYCLQQVIWRK